MDRAVNTRRLGGWSAVLVANVEKQAMEGARPSPDLQPRTLRTVASGYTAPGHVQRRGALGHPWYPGEERQQDLPALWQLADGSPDAAAFWSNNQALVTQTRRVVSMSGCATDASIRVIKHSGNNTRI